MPGKRTILDLGEFLEFLKTPHTNQEICKKFHVSREIVRRHLNKLLDEELIKQYKSGYYIILDQN